MRDKERTDYIDTIEALREQLNEATAANRRMAEPKAKTTVNAESDGPERLRDNRVRVCVLAVALMLKDSADHKAIGDGDDVAAVIAAYDEIAELRAMLGPIGSIDSDAATDLWDRLST